MTIDSTSLGRVAATVAERIKAARERAGLSQEALARQVGVATMTISRYETGSIKEPRGVVISAIAKATNVSETWLLTGRESTADGVAPDPPHWREFVDRYEHLDKLTGEQLEDLKRFAARNFKVRSWTDYERIAEIVRTSQPSPTFEAKRKRRDE